MSLKDAVRVATDHLPAELASPQSIGSIAQTAACFPDALTRQFGFECRLAPGQSTVDFIMRIHRAEGGREILAGSHDNVRLRPKIEAHAVWQRIRDFSRDWADTESQLHHNIQSLWLEFDSGASEDVPLPGIFFNVSNLDVGPTGVEDRAENEAHFGWVVERAIPLLRNRLPVAVARKVLACMDQSGSGAHVLQIGLFPSRKIDAVRLFVYTRTQADVLSYLDRIGWKGSKKGLAALIEGLLSVVDQIYLDVDIGESVYPKVGIEGQFNALKQPTAEPRWALLLASLVHRGLCTAEKRDALLRYPGSSIENFIYERVFFRGLHHIKLVYQEEHVVEAKAYIGCKHQPAAELGSLADRRPSIGGVCSDAGGQSKFPR